MEYMKPNRLEQQQIQNEKRNSPLIHTNRPQIHTDSSETSNLTRNSPNHQHSSPNLSSISINKVLSIANSGFQNAEEALLNNNSNSSSIKNFINPTGNLNIYMPQSDLSAAAVAVAAAQAHHHVQNQQIHQINNNNLQSIHHQMQPINMHNHHHHHHFSQLGINHPQQFNENELDNSGEDDDEDEEDIANQQNCRIFLKFKLYLDILIFILF